MKQQHPLSRKRVRSYQLKISDSMVDIPWFRLYSCAKCNKIMGAIGVRGIGFRINAQHMGDLVVELQCPHCDSGYDVHYRMACKNITHFAHLLISAGTIDGNPLFGEPVNSFNIKPQDNNLLSMILNEEPVKPDKKRIKGASCGTKNKVD
jgi:hypothetical protein